MHNKSANKAEGPYAPNEDNIYLPDGQDVTKAERARAERLKRATEVVGSILSELQALREKDHDSLRTLYDSLECIQNLYKEQKDEIFRRLCDPFCSLSSHDVAADLDRLVDKERDSVLNHYEMLLATASESTTDENNSELPLYLPLNITKRQIRLLHLLPGKTAERICCKMFAVSIDHNPVYSALSYTWGDEKVRSTITVNGRQVSITKSLEIALRNLRREDETVTIWADALCINQEDHAEKGRQIEQMWHVYAQAKCTMIWLGETADNSDLAMDFVQSLNDNDTEAIETRLDPVIATAVAKLLERPWWTRVWIIQEAFASTNAIVRCGKKEAPFYLFKILPRITFEFMNNAQRSLPESNLSLAMIAKCPLICMAFDFENAPTKEATSLEPWIIRAQVFKSKDPRDKIYALLGFGDTQQKESIRPDYTISFDELQFEVAARLLTNSYHRVTLQRGRDPTGSGNLPSWVRLGCAKMSYRPMIFPSKGHTPYSATGNSQVRPGFSYVRRQISLPGLVFDTIKFVSPRVIPPPSGPEIDESFWCITISVWQQCAKVMQHMTGDPYAKTCGADEAFWRTLILDRLVDWTGPPSSELGQCFEALMGGSQSREQYLRSGGPPEAEQDRTINLRLFRDALLIHLQGRSFFVTKKGYLGLAATVEAAQEGDSVCLIAGGEVPFILRDVGNGLHHLIGETYVHGIMDGSAWKYEKLSPGTEPEPNPSSTSPVCNPCNWLLRCVSRKYNEKAPSAPEMAGDNWRKQGLHQFYIT